MESTTLYFREGKSDKVYQATLDGDTAVFAWGPRGGTMQSNKVIGLPKAAKAYASKVAEKLAKGYRPGADATPNVAASPPPPAFAADVPRPMLLREIEQDQLVKLASDDGWWMQEKHDGYRVIYQWRADGRTLTGWMRSGKVAGTIPKPVLDAFRATFADGLFDDATIDGELVGDTFHAFDLLRLGPFDVRDRPYSVRLRNLEKMFAHSTAGVIVVETAKTAQEKVDLIGRMTAQAREGVVIKRAASTYTAGRPNSGGDCLKFKLVKTASVIVITEPAEHRSVRVGMVCGTDIGSVSVPPNQPVPPVGAVVEVRYLNIQRGGSLYQPFLLGVREDMEHADCTMDQLKYKNEAAA